MPKITFKNLNSFYFFFATIRISFLNNIRIGNLRNTIYTIIPKNSTKVLALLLIYFFCATASAQCTITTVNADFEFPVVSSSATFINQNTNSAQLGWKTTATDGMLEFWKNGGIYGRYAYSGTQFAELNANHSSGLYQDFNTITATYFTYSFAHMGRDGTDTMELMAGPPGGPYILIQKASTGKSWKLYSGAYDVPTGQSTTRFIFQARATATGDLSAGNFLDAVSFRAKADPPIIKTNEATCLTAGTSTISNHVAGNVYTFYPAGPIVNDTTGLINNMIIGTSYKVSSRNSNCNTPLSNTFYNAPRLVRPYTRYTNETRCFGQTYTWNINNITYDASGTYTFDPNDCSPIQVLNLDIRPKPADDITNKTIYNGQKYTWINGIEYSESAFVTIYKDGCSANQVLNLKVKPIPAEIIATGVTICKGGTGSLTVIPSPPSPETIFDGHWNPATDPKAAIPFSIYPNTMNNSTVCSFNESVESNYTATKFKVSISGIYQFKMTEKDYYDGVAYIYSGDFTPGKCPGGGKWIIGDDDDDRPGGGKEPKMTPYLEAGVTYTLISTLWATSSGTYAGDYTWTVTPPAGGEFILNNLNYWYTSPSGGIPIGWGTSFNPVGVAGSGLLDTNTPSTTTYYVDDGTENPVRAAVDFVITDDSGAGNASATPTLCVNTALTNITHTTTATTGIGIATGLPPGVTAAWSSNTITISGKPTATGVFNYTIPLTGGCGSVFAGGRITVTPKPIDLVTTESICFGETYIWPVNDVEYTTSQSALTITNNGCTANQILNLTVTPKPIDLVTTESICFGETYIWPVNGVEYTTSQNGLTITNGGCTANQILNLTVILKPIDIITTESICFGETYIWPVNGVEYTTSQSGLTITNNGCTANQILNLTVTPKPIDIVTTESICFGETYIWPVNGVEYTTSQSALTITNDGCTANQILNLTVTPKPIDIVTTESICFGETYIWPVNGVEYTTSQSALTITNDGCTANQILNLTVTPKPIDIVTTESICFGETYIWPVNGVEYTTSQSGLTITNNGCKANQILNLTVSTVLTSSVIDNSLFPEFCAGDKDGSFGIEIEGGSAPYSLSLNDINGTYEQIAGNVHSYINLAGGLYSVYIKDSQNCNTQIDVRVQNGIALNPTIKTNSECNNNLPSNSITVTVNPSILNLADIEYTLDGNSNGYQSTNVFTNLIPGEHTVTARHINGCEQTSLPFIIEHFEPLSLTLTDGELNEIVANADGGTKNYQYKLDDEYYGTVNKFTINKSGTYNITVTDQNGCSVTVSKYFTFIDICIPNYFTPNGDGVNDEWAPDCTINYKNLTYTVFDRYGRIIAKYRLGQKWDGKYNGAELSAGDYWYILKLNDSKDNREFVGHFTLYR